MKKATIVPKVCDPNLSCKWIRFFVILALKLGVFKEDNY